MLNYSHRLAIYMEGAVRGYGGKMGFGILRYSANDIACVIDSETGGLSIADEAGISRDTPIVASLEDAVRLGANVLVLGIAPPGGLIPPAWWPVIEAAVGHGLSIVNGLHDLVSPRFPQLSEKTNPFIWDIRVEPEGLQPGTAAAAQLANRRALLIGTDMAIGKMTAGLEMLRVARDQGIRTEFVATGQIGITITGAGVPLDAIRVDFASGAIEREVLSFRDAELVIVEGQGSLIHPGSTANLPLLRGSCPTHLILCHRAGQQRLLNRPEVVIPPLEKVIRLYEDLAEACGTFLRPKTVAVALNTAELSPSEADDAVRAVESELGLPTTDPIRYGPEALVRAVMV